MNSDIPNTSLIGKTLGPYAVRDKLGEGGMGQVYRGHDSKLGRDVALKVLPDSFAIDPDRLARFHREAQVLASLNHPNIAQIYGFEDSGATHALVMELVDGPTLADRIEQGPIPLAEALAIAKQISSALEAAHEQGIVHRDLKPANVKVRSDGTVKVLDFGLAKAMDPTSSSDLNVMNSPTLTQRATQLGMILGTAAYMAPEQAKGKKVDRRADIWAFGVVLFEMLSGERAFKGDDVSDVLAAVLRQDIDWRALPADTPARVRRVLERCLERDPTQRLRDIGDVWILMDVPDEPAVAAGATVATARTSTLWRWLPWGVAMLTATASIVWGLSRRSEPAPQLVARSAQIVKDLSLFVATSRDGTRIAYAVAGGQNSSAGIVLRMLDQFDGRIVPGTEGGAFPVFSPDGQWIAYADLAGKIKKIPITGGTSIALCEGSFQSGGAWSDDGVIVFPGPKGLMRVSADGGVPEPLTTVDSSKGETGHVRPQFLPGGRRTLFTVTTQNDAQFAVRDLDKTGHRIVAKGGSNGQYVASGHLTFVRGTTLFAIPFDLSRLEVTGSEVPVVENVSLIGPPGTADYAVSASGVLAYFSSPGSGGTTLAWADRTGQTKVLPGPSRQLWGTGRLSPDGHLVANGISNERNGSDVWTLDVERGTLTRLSFGSGIDINDLPIWTPDGRGVIYSGDAEGKHGLYAVPADASARPKLLFATESRAIPRSVTPDGRTLIYSEPGPDKRQRLMMLPLLLNGASAQPQPLHADAAGGENDGQVSPDGRWIAYESNESGGQEVYVQPFPGPGPKTRISLDGGSTPRWSKDGRELFYWARIPVAKLMAVDVATSPDFRAGTPRELFRQPSTTTWDITSDRNRFLVELSARSTGSTLAIVTNWFEELNRRAPARK
jgi:eukaryotic-like serine/threonine-protein kinase